MSVRIALVSPMAGNPADEKRRQVAEKVFIRNANKLKEEGTTIDYHLLEKGFTSTDYFCSEAFSVWNDFEVFHTVRGLERQGYDAAVIHCFSDPLLFPCRQVVDLPVIGVVQTSLMFASLMGPRFGVITFCRPLTGIIDRLIEKYGYKSLAGRTLSMDTKPEEFVRAYNDSHELIARFERCARRSIEDGAEVLVPGCMVMANLLCVPQGCDEYPQGIKEVDGVPVLDVLSTAVRMAEVLVSMKKAGVPWISRHRTFGRPDQATLRDFMSDFPYHGSGSWHY